MIGTFKTGGISKWKEKGCEKAKKKQNKEEISIEI